MNLKAEIPSSRSLLKKKYLKHRLQSNRTNYSDRLCIQYYFFSELCPSPDILKRIQVYKFCIYRFHWSIRRLVSCGGPGSTWWFIFLVIVCVTFKSQLTPYIVISLVLFDGFNFDFVAGLILCLQEDFHSFYCALYCCISIRNLVWFIDPLLQLMKSEFLKICVQF